MHKPCITKRATTWLNNFPIHPCIINYINYVLRGISQVAFINNSLTGLLIILAIGINHPELSVMGLIGCMSTTLFAIHARIPLANIRNGNLGFPGTLTGFALYTLSNNLYQIDFGLLVIFSLPFFYTNVLIIKYLAEWFSKKTGLPYFTLPYNLSVYLALLVTLTFSPTPTEFSNTEVTEHFNILSINLLHSILVNIGQVFFVADLFTSTLILMIILLTSPLLALLAMNGAIVFIIFSMLIGVDLKIIQSGVIGYNAVLTSIVLGGVMYMTTLKTILISTVASIWTTIFTIIISYALSLWGLPVLTLPFCIATITFLYFGWKLTPRLFGLSINMGKTSASEK